MTFFNDILKLLTSQCVVIVAGILDDVDKIDPIIIGSEPINDSVVDSIGSENLARFIGQHGPYSFRLPDTVFKSTV